MTTWPAVNRLGIDGLPVPALRGRIHQATVIPFGLIGLATSFLVDGMVARFSIVVFSVSVVAMLTASAAYHCHSHSMETKLTTRRLDHAMIFVAIAGTQSAYWLLVAGPGVAAAGITIVWGIAAFGIYHKFHTLTLAKSSGSWLYIGLGWTGLAMVPWLVASGDAVAFAAVVGGGLVYTGGGAVLAHRLIDPWPRVFGYHEVWHLMVVVGVFAHFAGIVRLAVTVA